MRARIVLFSTSISLFVLVVILYASQVVYSERHQTAERAQRCLKHASISPDRLKKSEVYRGTMLITTLYVHTDQGDAVLFCNAEGEAVHIFPQSAIVPETSIEETLKKQFPTAALLKLTLGWDFDRPIYEAKVALSDHAWGLIYYGAKDGTFLRSLILPPS